MVLNSMKLQDIINDLKKIDGLHNIKKLTARDIKYIIKNEERRNIGVHEAVSRTNVIMVTHDSTFRKAANKIVMKKKGRIYFPPVKFPEIKAIDVVSSSPGILVHEYLVKKFKIKTNNGATLIIGFDLK